jgi:hypothetical protein
VSKSRFPCGGAASPHLAAGEPLATTTRTEGVPFTEIGRRCEAKKAIKQDGGENRKGGKV